MDRVDLNLTKEIENNTEEIILNTGSRICSICLKEKSIYTCPRCNINYCSLPCYKHEKHLHCSELFYKDWVMEQLHDTRSRSEEKEKMMEMLARVEKEEGGVHSDGDDGEEEEDLETRLQGIDLDDTESVLSRLTEREKGEFDKLLTEGHLGGLVQVWNPWWLHSTKLVQEIEEMKTVKKETPELYSPIPDVHSLIRVKPSTDIRYNIINIFYSYCFVCRLYNGGHFDNPVDSVEDFLSICCVLNKGENFNSLEMAIEETIQLVQKEGSRWDVTVDFTVGVLDDVKMLVHGGEIQPTLTNMMLALSDVTRLLQSAYKILHTDKKRGNRNDDEESKRRRKVIQRSIKKCVFLLSWSQRYGMAVCNLIPELELETGRRKVEIKQVEETKTEFEKTWKGKLPPLKKQLISPLS